MDESLKTRTGTMKFASVSNILGLKKTCHNNSNHCSEEEEHRESSTQAAEEDHFDETKAGVSKERTSAYSPVRLGCPISEETERCIRPEMRFVFHQTKKYIEARLETMKLRHVLKNVKVVKLVPDISSAQAGREKQKTLKYVLQVPNPRNSSEIIVIGSLVGKACDMKMKSAAACFADIITNVTSAPKNVQAFNSYRMRSLHLKPLLQILRKERGRMWEVIFEDIKTLIDMWKDDVDGDTRRGGGSMSSDEEENFDNPLNTEASNCQRTCKRTSQRDCDRDFLDPRNIPKRQRSCFAPVKQTIQGQGTKDKQLPQQLEAEVFSESQRSFEDIIAPQKPVSAPLQLSSRRLGDLSAVALVQAGDGPLGLYPWGELFTSEAQYLSKQTKVGLVRNHLEHHGQKMLREEEEKKEQAEYTFKREAIVAEQKLAELDAANERRRIRAFYEEKDHERRRQLEALKLLESNGST